MSTKISIPIKIDSPDAILGALQGNASAAQREGPAWMLTEFIENGIDAIKHNREPQSNGGSDFKGLGKVTLEIDEDHHEVRIIDNGTGILDAVWIVEHPFKSMKKGVSYDQIGNFGRGITGFRGFCNELVYVTLRKQPSTAEKNHLAPNEDAKCVMVTFYRNKAEGNYEVVNKKLFNNYCNYETGTVAILKNWRSDEFEKLLAKKGKIYSRIQHHFGEEVKQKQIEITIKRNKKVEKVGPRDFSKYAYFEIPDVEVKNPSTEKVYGKINVHIFQTNPLDNHDYKHPFLLIKGRPLQKSFLCDMDEFENQDVWSSPYVTGYIECNFLKPNELRIAIDSVEDEKKYFVQAITAIGIDLKKLVSNYVNALMEDKRRNENQKLVMDIQSFIKRAKIPIDFKNFDILGKLTQSQEAGTQNTDRLSIVAGESNKGLITNNGTMQEIITYKKQDYKHRPDPPILIPLPVPTPTPPKTRGLKDPKHDGQSQKVVWVDPKQTSQGGRKRKQTFRGPGLDVSHEELVDELSWYEPTVQKVIVNSGHKFYKKLEKKSKNSTSVVSTYSQKLKNYIAERYIWEVIMKFVTGNREEKEKIFWDIKYQYFQSKDTT